MNKTYVSGAIGLLVIAFAIFAVGSLFDPGEYIAVLLAVLALGVLFAFFLRKHFAKRDESDKLEIFDAVNENERASETRKVGAEQLAAPDRPPGGR